MKIYVSLAVFSLIILLYWVISELFTILFRFTGLPDEKARFQVVSLLTGCGFTTKESEMFLSTRSRRSLARITMLFGYVFNITIVSTFVSVLFSLKISQAENYLFGILMPVSVAAVIFVFMRFPLFRAWGDRVLEGFANRLIRGGDINTVILLDYIGKETIALVTLHHIPEEYFGMSLSQMGLRANTGLLVMLVEHPGKKPEAAGPNTVFQVGDKLTVFGDYAVICRTFDAHERFADL
jgi:K+ transport systems, NAD-binding component